MDDIKNEYEDAGWYCINYNDGTSVLFHAVCREELTYPISDMDEASQVSSVEHVAACLYETRSDCVDNEIIEPIEATGVASAEEYDVDAIADLLVHTVYTEGNVPLWYVSAEEDEFWGVVSEHEVSVSLKNETEASRDATRALDGRDKTPVEHDAVDLA